MFLRHRLFLAQSEDISTHFGWVRKRSRKLAVDPHRIMSNVPMMGSACEFLIRCQKTMNAPNRNLRQAKIIVQNILTEYANGIGNLDL